MALTSKKSVETPQFKSSEADTFAQNKVLSKSQEAPKTDFNMMKKQTQGAISSSSIPETKSTEQNKPSTKSSIDEGDEIMIARPATIKSERSEKSDAGTEDDDDDNFNIEGINPQSQEAEVEEDDDDPLDFIGGSKPKAQEKKEPPKPSAPKEGFGRAFTTNPTVQKGLFGDMKQNGSNPVPATKKGLFNSDTMKSSIPPINQPVIEDSKSSPVTRIEDINTVPLQSFTQNGSNLVPATKKGLYNSDNIKSSIPPTNQPVIENSKSSPVTRIEDINTVPLQSLATKSNATPLKNIQPETKASPFTDVISKNPMKSSMKESTKSSPFMESLNNHQSPNTKHSAFGMPEGRADSSDQKESALKRSVTTQNPIVSSGVSNFNAKKTEVLRKQAMESFNQMKITAPINHHESMLPPDTNVNLYSSQKTDLDQNENEGTNERNEKFERGKFERNNTKSKTITHIAQIDNEKIRRLETDASKKENELHSLREKLDNKTLEAQRLERREAELLLELENLKKDTSSSKQNVDQEIILLRQKLAEANQQRGQLNDKVVIMNSSTEEMKQKLYEMSDENRNLKKEMIVLKQDINNLEIQNGQHVANLNSVKSRYENYENEITNLKSTIENLRGQIRTADQEKDTILKEKEDMTGSKTEIEKDYIRQKERNKFLETENNELKDRLRGVGQDKNTLMMKATDKFTEMDNYIKKLQGEHAALKENYENFEKSSKEQIDSLEKKNVELKSKLMDAEKRAEEALNQQTSLLVELQSIQRTASEPVKKSEGVEDPVKVVLEGEIKRLKDSMKTSVENYEQSIQEKLRVADQLKTENRELKFNYQQIREHNEVLVKKIQKLEADLTNAATSNPEDSGSEYQTIKKNYEVKLQNQAKLLEEKENQIREFQASLSTLEQQTARFRSDYDSLNQEKENGNKRANAEINEKIKELEKKFLDNEFILKKQIEELKRENQTLKESSATGTTEQDDMAKLTLENESLRKQVKDLSSMRQSRQETANKEFEALKIKTKDNEKTLTKLQEELAIKRQRLSELEDSNIELNKKFETQNTKAKKVEDTLTIMEAELVKTKQKLGEVMSLLMDAGQDELIDKVYEIVDGEK